MVHLIISIFIVLWLRVSSNRKLNGSIDILLTNTVVAL